MRSIRPQLVILITGGLLLLFGLWGVAEGPADISLAHVVGVLAKACGLSVDATWPAWVESVVLQIRLPRIITGMFVGAALGLSGATLQGLFRNALAEPSIIGISSGASLGAVLAIYFGLAALSVWSIPVMAFLGASLTTFAVYSIATDRGHTPTETLLLAGVAIGALNTAISAFVMAMALSRWEVGQQILFWSMGGLEGRTWEHALLIAPTVLLGGGMILSYSRDLDALLLGEVHAVSVGIDVPHVRKVLIVFTSLVTGTAVAVAGGVAFVGLIVPHILRLLMGPQNRWLLPASMVGGGLFVVAADLAIRMLFADKPVPLGVVTAFVGAPFFLFLLIQHRKEFRL